MSRFGLLNSYRLYKPDGSVFCLIVPGEKDFGIFSLLGCGEHCARIDGAYKWSDFERFKQEHNLRTADEIKVSKLRKLHDHI